MSMSDMMTEVRDRPELPATARYSTGQGRAEASIVPRNTIAGRALVAVIAIMTFLAALTSGAVLLVASSALEWQSEISREMTIQVRPTAGRDIEAEVSKAAAIAR